MSLTQPGKDVINGLPAEILIQILEWAHEECNKSPDVLLVCHKWRIVAEPILWREFNSSRGSLRTRQLIASLRSCPRFRQYLQKLELRSHIVGFSGEDVNSIRETIQLCQNLREVTLHLQEPYSPLLVDALGGLSRLQTLELSGFTRQVISTKWSLGQVALPRGRRKGNLRSLSLRNVQLELDLVKYLLSLPLTLEVLELRHLRCCNCHDEACIEWLLQSILGRHQETLRRISVNIDWGCRRPRLLDFSPFTRLESLCLSTDIVFAEDPSEAYRKLSAPLLRRLDLRFGSAHDLLCDDKTIRESEQRWIESFMSMLATQAPHGKLRHVHLLYNPRPTSCYDKDNWPWDRVLDLEKSAGDLGFNLTYDKPRYTRKEWENFQNQGSIIVRIL